MAASVMMVVVPSCPPSSSWAKGTRRGIRIDMVPQLVPIEKATKAAKAKTVAGKMRGEARCPRVSIRYLPRVFRV